jgi:hypothetical protein
MQVHSELITAARRACARKEGPARGKAGSAKTSAAACRVCKACARKAGPACGKAKSTADDFLKAKVVIRTRSLVTKNG